MQLAWAKFHPLEIVFTNKHFSVKLRLKLLDAVVTPTILFVLVPMPLTQRELIRLDVLQTRMMTSIVGWVRMENESWRGAMARMQGSNEQPHNVVPFVSGPHNWQKNGLVLQQKMSQKMDGLKVFLHGVPKPTGKTFFGRT